MFNPTMKITKKQHTSTHTMKLRNHHTPTEHQVEAHGTPTKQEPEAEASLFPFLKLPAEIRNKIYRYVCRSGTLPDVAMEMHNQRIRFRDASSGDFLRSLALPGSAMLQTCKQVRAEAQASVSATLSTLTLSFSGPPFQILTIFPFDVAAPALAPVPAEHNSIIRISVPPEGVVEIFRFVNSSLPAFLASHGIKKVPLKFRLTGRGETGSRGGFGVWELGFDGKSAEHVLIRLAWSESLGSLIPWQLYGMVTCWRG